MRKIYLLMLAMCFVAMANGQVTVTNPGNTTPGLAATYASLAAAVTDLNLQTAISGPVTITLDAANPQTSPAGGYVINAALAGASGTNTVTFEGSSNTITAPATHTVGALTDAIFKILGSDFITIQGFTILENAANTTTAAATNNMTEFGVALFYNGTTNGAQNITIQNNTITLNRTYQNTWGIYSNSTHSATVITTSASATTTAGSNSNLKVYGNTISNVNQGISVVGPTAAADMNTGLDIGGTSAPQGNSITNWGTTGTFSGYVNVSGTLNCILVRNSTGFNVSYNTLTSSVGGNTATTSQRAIYVIAFSVAPTGTFTNTINNNNISVQSGFATGSVNGIINESTTGTATSNLFINSNNFNTFGHTVAASGACTFINSTMAHLNTTINSNTFTSITLPSTGSATFISNSVTVPATGSQTINSNSIVTSFSKTGAGGTVTGITTAGSSTTITSNWNGNNFSNMTVTGATAITFINQTDGGSVNHNIIGNTFSTITGGTSTITGIISNFGGQLGSAGNLVSGNTISGISSAGTITAISIGASGTGGLSTVTGNTISGLTTTGASTVTGITSSAPTNCNILKNKICNLEANNAAGVVSGITVSSGILHTVYNNLIGDLRAPSSNPTSPATAITGINITSATASSAVNVYFNTVYINATSSGANFATAGISHAASATATTAALNLRNNIIVNTSTPAGTGFTIAYRRSVGTAGTLANYASTSNNNLFYAGTPGASNLIYSDGTGTATTLAAYKAGAFTAGTIAPRDASSVTENAPFLSTTCGSANFLHIDATVATQIESGGTTVAGITDDYDGNVRNVTTPDIGADEGTFTLADFTAPSISYTPLSFTCDGTVNRALTTSITDASGVPTAGAGLPVLYWKINAGAWNPATATFVSGSTYTFSFGIGAVVTDVVSYYIVAQDNAGTPNVGAFPSAGATGFTVNPPAASTAPTTPSSYTINNSLSGSYTVGAAGTYTTLTAAVAAYNVSCLGGPVVFSLTDATYPSETFPITINANPDASGTNTLTIKATQAGTTMSGSSASALVVLNGADYVILDGSTGSTANTVCPLSVASRDLTITNTNVSTTSAVIMLQTTVGANPATNNTVKNCVIVGNSNTTTLVGIHIGGTTVASGTGANLNNNNSIVNNDISKAVIGIFTAGSGIATKSANTIINQNVMTTSGANSIGRFGIMSLLEDNLTVSGNSVSGIVYTGIVDAAGICVGANGGFTTTSMTGGEVTNATITNNVIGTVQQTNTYSVSGIAVLTGTTGTMLVANNMLSGVNGNGTIGDFSTGIYVTGGTGSTINVYYNTVTMTGTLGGADESSYAFAILSGSPTVNVRNNIFTSTGSTGANRNRAFGLGFALPAANLVSDNNDLFASGTGSVVAQTTTLDNTGGVNHTTLLDWQTNASKDAASKNVQPTFVSATDLHLVTPDAVNFNNLESFGVVVSVTTDIDCQSRPNGTLPDIGADEFVGALPSCNVPTSVTVGTITTTSASVSFTCAACTGSYIVEYGLPGFTPGTGATAGAGGTVVTGAASPIALSGLTVATTYQVYVRQDCGFGSYSNNSTVVSFTTLCNAASLPYTENFDAVTTPAVPNCSLVENVNGATTWATGTINPRSAPNCLTYTFDGTLPGDDWWFTPDFNLTGGTSYRLTFWYRARSASFPEALEVKYGNGQNAAAMTSPAIFTNASIANTTYSQAVVDFTPGSTGVYNIGFHNISIANQWELYVDDIGVDVTPACPAPAQPTMSGITFSAATATWAGAGSFILEYGPTGYTPGTGATAGATGTLVDPAVSPQALSGLTASTTYDLYVRMVCAGPTWSANSVVRTFTTLAAPPANDEVSGAFTLTVGAGCTGAPYTNVAATSGATEPYPSCSGAKQSPVWFSFVAPASGAVRVSTDLGTSPIFTDSKIGLFSGTDLVAYSDFQIISCDDDGGSVIGSGFESVVYATSLTPGTTYYIAVDKFSSGTTNGTFCIAVDELDNSMLSANTGCAGTYQIPGGSVATYTGWVPLLDGTSKLIALVRNPAGGAVSSYSVAENINAAAVRSASGVFYLDRNFRINNSTATSVDVQFFYLNSELVALNAANGSATAGNLGASRQGGTTCQSDYSSANGAIQFLSQSANGVTTDGLVRWIQVLTPSFSNFYLQSSVGGVLPTSLLAFSGQKEGSVNKLRWTTSTEQNNRGFEVQRSIDGVIYTALGFVNSQALGGNSTDILNYSFIDNTPVGAKQYYRLRQVDIDNRSRLSNIVLIKGSKPVTLAIGGLFPNPANSQINVILDAPLRDKVTLVVIDAAGKSIIQKVVNVEAGSNTVPVDISHLTNGSYLVKLVCSSNCESAVGKFVKQ